MISTSSSAKELLTSDCDSLETIYFLFDLFSFLYNR